MTPSRSRLRASTSSSSARRRASCAVRRRAWLRQDVVVSDRDLVGHRLVGALRLESGDVARKSCLLVEAQPTAEVEEQPLDLQLGQLEGRPEVQADGHGSDARQEVESREPLLRAGSGSPPLRGQTPPRRNCPRQSAGTSRTRSVAPPGLGDALELGTQTGLKAERQSRSPRGASMACRSRRWRRGPPRRNRSGEKARARTGPGSPRVEALRWRVVAAPVRSPPARASGPWSVRGRWPAALLRLTLARSPSPSPLFDVCPVATSAGMTRRVSVS